MIESVDLLASATGNVLRSEIVGCIKMRVYLSGMPELRYDKCVTSFIDNPAIVSTLTFDYIENSNALSLRLILNFLNRLGLNDKVLFESTGRGKSKSVELEDVKFHQCVRLSRYLFNNKLARLYR